MTVPVTILTGFLGSGKTTMLNKLLEESVSENTAVIINEFGDTFIDSHLVIPTKEEIIEINSGCICCNVRQDLITLLQNINIENKNIDRVIIETTGLADPAPIIQTFLMEETISDAFEIDSVITMIDGRHITMHFHEDEVKSQIAFADTMIINKIDLIDEAALSALKHTLFNMNRTAEVFTTEYGNVHINHLMNRYTFNLNHVLEIAPDLADNSYHHHHDNETISIVLKVKEPLDMEKVNQMLGYLVTFKGESLYRYKGILNVTGTNRKIVFQGVHMTFAGMDGPLWTEKEDRQSEIVFIGKGLDSESLNKWLQYCLA